MVRNKTLITVYIKDVQPSDAGKYRCGKADVALRVTDILPGNLIIILFGGCSKVDSAIS